MRLKNPKSRATDWKTNQILVGAVDGLNRFFTTPSKFIYDPSEGISPVIKRNGQTVYLAIQVKSISESGGLGSGYDTIEFLKPPKRKDMLTADYLAAD